VNLLPWNQTKYLVWRGILFNEVIDIGTRIFRTTGQLFNIEGISV